MARFCNIFCSLFLVTTIAAPLYHPAKAEAIDFGILDNLIEQALGRIDILRSGINGFIKIVSRYYDNPSLSGTINLSRFLTSTFNSFSSFNLSNPNLGEYGACIKSPTAAAGCVCTFVPGICFQAAQSAAALSEGDPLNDLGDIMVSISFELGEDHPVVQQFLDFARAIADAQNAADKLTAAKSKLQKAKSKLKAVKAAVKAGSLSVNDLDKAKKKVAKAKTKLAEANRLIDLLEQIDPVGTELDKLGSALQELHS